MSESYPTPPTYCYNHPDRETTLRCNRCDRPICTQCAVLTPTGYRCKECVRGQQKIFETAQPLDYALGFGIAVVLSYVGSLIASFLGFFTLFVAPVAGMIIAEAVRAAVRRRRSKRLFQVVVAAVVLGSLYRVVIVLLGSLGANVYGLLPLLWQGLYTFLVASSVYYRLAGIQMRY